MNSNLIFSVISIYEVDKAQFCSDFSTTSIHISIPIKKQYFFIQKYREKFGFLTYKVTDKKIFI
jgi:hypothetical protein